MHHLNVGWFHAINKKKRDAWGTEIAPNGHGNYQITIRINESIHVTANMFPLPNSSETIANMRAHSKQKFELENLGSLLSDLIAWEDVAQIRSENRLST